MPLIRHGDLIFTAIVLQRLLKGIVPYRAVADVRGGIGGYARNLFGHDSAGVAANVFGNRMLAKEVLAGNTLFGVYSRGMSRDAAAAWAQKLISGEPYSTSSALGITASYLDKLSSPMLRSCSACIDYDHATQGFSAWRVLHQVAALDRCPEHGLPLIDEIAPGGRRDDPRLWPMQLPGDSHEQARPMRRGPTPISDGYASYLKLWTRLFAGELSAVEPAPWIRLITSVVARFGVEEARALIEDEIVRSWGLAIEVIAERFSLVGGWSFVGQEIKLNTRAKDIARRLVLYTALDRLGFVRHEDALLSQKELPFIHRRGTDSTSHAELGQSAFENLSDLAICRGLPLAVGKALATDVNCSNVGHDVGISDTPIYTFVKTLPTELLSNLARLHDWDPRSWLSVEIARRNGINAEGERVTSSHSVCP